MPSGISSPSKSSTYSIPALVRKIKDSSVISNTTPLAACAFSGGFKVSSSIGCGSCPIQPQSKSAAMIAAACFPFMAFSPLLFLRLFRPSPLFSRPNAYFIELQFLVFMCFQVYFLKPYSTPRNICGHPSVFAQKYCFKTACCRYFFSTSADQQLPLFKNRIFNFAAYPFAAKRESAGIVQASPLVSSASFRSA